LSDQPDAPRLPYPAAEREAMAWRPEGSKADFDATPHPALQFRVS